MKSFLFPDINVWIALTWAGHIHHAKAHAWFGALDQNERIFFCRVTQLGFLRLLTSEPVMGVDVRSQEAAWVAFDHWLADDRVSFLDEPPKVEQSFRLLTTSARAAPRDWADSYLAAFATAARLTLVTFDRDFRGKASNLVLLEG